MSHEQALGGESVWLDIDVGSSNTLQEAGFSDIGISADEKSSGVRVDRGKTAEMLSHLVEVEEWIFQSSTDCRHSTQCCALELLALEEGLRIFEQSDIISGDNLNEVLCGRQLAESYSEVVRIVEGIEEIFVKGVDVLQTWEAIENEGKLLGEGFLCKFDLSCIEIWDKSVFERCCGNFCVVLRILLI